MQFNPATASQSLVAKVDDLVDTNANKYPLVQKARSFNTALDKAYSIIFSHADTKNYDDRNYSTLPQGTFDITATERNITIDSDEEGAEILRIHKVIAKNSAGTWYDLQELDIRDKAAYEIAEGDETGQVMAYDWVGHSLVFDVTPEATIANGLKVFYMRNSSYFTEDDTTKEPGLPVIFQPYLVYFAAWEYATRKGLQMRTDFKREMVEIEDQMQKFLSTQTVVDNLRMRPASTNAL